MMANPTRADLEKLPAADLLTAGRAAGLSVRVDDDRLVVRGPRAAKHLGEALLARKPEVVLLLKGDGAQGVTPAATPDGTPTPDEPTVPAVAPEPAEDATSTTPPADGTPVVPDGAELFFGDEHGCPRGPERCA